MAPRVLRAIAQRYSKTCSGRKLIHQAPDAGRDKRKTMVLTPETSAAGRSSSLERLAYDFAGKRRIDAFDLTKIASDKAGIRRKAPQARKMARFLHQWRGLHPTPQHFRDAPCLRDTSSWRMGLVRVEDLTD